MKYPTMIKLIAGAGMALGSLNATASGFGGSWSHDSYGTIHNSNAPEVTSSAASRTSGKGSGFGGGWMHDGSGTISRADVRSPEPQQVSSDKTKTARYKNSFGGGWGHDGSGTISRNL